jgi:hypothetical protein
MAVSVQWDNPEKTVIRFDYDAHWVWDDFHHAVDQAFLMVDEIDHEVASILDMTHSLGMPPNAMAHARTLTQHQHPRIAVQVTVGGNRFVKLMTDAFVRMYGSLGGKVSSYFVNTVDEARYLITHELKLEA